MVVVIERAIKLLLTEHCLADLKQRRCYLLILTFSVMLNNEKSPVQTENEQTYNKSVFIENFKKLYLQQPIEVILDHFVKCHIQLSEYEEAEAEKEELLMMLIRTEVYNA